MPDFCGNLLNKRECLAQTALGADRWKKSNGAQLIAMSGW
jgi:hypothetical protein